MKILLLTNRIPYPPLDGGSIATYNMIMGLKEAGWDVSLFSLNTKKHYFNPVELPENFISQPALTTCFVNTDVKVLPAFLNLFSSQAYNVSRFYHPDVEKALEDLLRNSSFDAIQFEGLFMTPYLDKVRKYSGAPVLLRAHNVEHQIWERMARQAAIPKKWYLSLLSSRLKSYEKAAIPRFDAVAAITSKDAGHFEELSPQQKHIFPLPAGIDTSLLEPDFSQVEENAVFHIGSLDWLPNQEGVRWFLENVWPEVKRKVPEAKFYLAGRNIPAELNRIKAEGVEVVGEVESAYEFIKQKGIMVVPLLSGSGIRIKILEGMALQKAIVSTSLGAEGIECEHEKNILLADKAETFARQIIRLLQDKDQMQAIGEKARSEMIKNHGRTAIAREITEYYKRKL